ncbi:MAG: protein phosphatase 2C domain-containing protein [candidate division KSB1 bacterium]|nr:protein phosphatase 2C domain-containing protein [candidate division KSB1 bacterium]
MDTMNDQVAPTIQLQMAAATDTGKVRQHNEDFFYYSEKHQFFVICDGMGGHKAGQLASRMAGETLKEAVLQEKFLDIKKMTQDVADDLPPAALQLIAGVRLANRRLFNHARAHPELKGMGTTLVAGIIRHGWLYLIHAGDSRFYRLRHQQLERLTRDHTWLNELIEDQEISEDEAEAFRQKNVLTRALGIAPTIKIDLRIEPVRPDDLYLLCTDGLHNALADALIRSVLSADHGSLQKAVEKIVLNARLLDGSDNITAGLIHIETCPEPGSNIHPLERTIPDEPDKVSQHLDRILKAHFGVQKPARRIQKPMLIAASLLALALLAGSFFLRQNATQASSSAAQDTVALLSDDWFKTVSDDPAMDPAGRPEAGWLVLIQAVDSTDIEALRYLNGIRVLDIVKNVHNRPLVAGNYTWALADSTRKVVYQRADIQLMARNRWPQTDPMLEEKPAESSDIVVRTGDEPRAVPRRRGRVYLVGNFDEDPFRQAQIYINEWPLGLLDNYLDKGFYLRQGRYSIAIRDQDGKLLRLKRDVRIIGGKTIAIEF